MSHNISGKPAGRASPVTTPGADPGVPAFLAQTGWEVRELAGTPVTDPAPTLQFSDMAVSGNTGCNGFSGPVTLTADGFSLGPLAAGRMVCDRATHDRERLLFDLLARVRSGEIAEEGRVLMLRDGAGVDLVRAIRQ